VWRLDDMGTADMPFIDGDTGHRVYTKYLVKPALVSQGFSSVREGRIQPQAAMPGAFSFIGAGPKGVPASPV
jgi:hypothetical protein